jgi:hypothetical protein
LPVAGAVSVPGSAAATGAVAATGSVTATGSVAATVSATGAGSVTCAGTRAARLVEDDLRAEPLLALAGAALAGAALAGGVTSAVGVASVGDCGGAAVGDPAALACAASRGALTSAALASAALTSGAVARRALACGAGRCAPVASGACDDGACDAEGCGVEGCGAGFGECWAGAGAGFGAVRDPSRRCPGVAPLARDPVPVPGEFDRGFCLRGARPGRWPSEALWSPSPGGGWNVTGGAGFVAAWRRWARSAGLAPGVDDDVDPEGEGGVVGSGVLNVARGVRERGTSRFACGRESWVGGSSIRGSLVAHLRFLLLKVARVADLTITAAAPPHPDRRVCAPACRSGSRQVNLFGAAGGCTVSSYGGWSSDHLGRLRLVRSMAPHC